MQELKFTVNQCHNKLFVMFHILQQYRVTVQSVYILQ